MKRKYLFVICMLLLCGCADGTDSLESSRVDTLQSTGESSLIDIAAPQQTTPPNRENVPNEIAFYTADEAKKIIEDNTRFTVSEDFLCFASVQEHNKPLDQTERKVYKFRTLVVCLLSTTEYF